MGRHPFLIHASGPSLEYSHTAKSKCFENVDFADITNRIMSNDEYHALQTFCDSFIQPPKEQGEIPEYPEIARVKTDFNEVYVFEWGLN
jgi:hypothetical protein